ncbi:MAG TPA: TIGR04053 family radical SAM/SPASM domain-containing protein [bacterium]|nr:TIGR04053 family radical SAM/SPASM domain-containing protein [bacterium]
MHDHPQALRPQDLYRDRPYIAIWEVTRACDLACVHCRAEAQDRAYPGELDTEQALDLIRQVAEWKVPLFVMTGGDPLKRPDLSTLVAECSRLKMNFALAPSITPLLTRERLKELKDAGVHRISLSLDGSNPATFDAFRGVPGTFDRFLDAAHQIRDLGIRLQINTTIGRHNRFQVPAMADLIRRFDIDLWSVFFLVPTGRAQRDQALNATDTEIILNQLYDVMEKGWFDVKTTEAHHFRRIILQRRGVTPEQLMRGDIPPHDVPLRRVARGVSDGRGFVFISHTGDVCPSGFLPLSGGNVKSLPLSDIYRHSPLFQRLRDADSLQGKCGRCDYRQFCGGSRARGYALTGNVMGADPYCSYQPQEQEPVALF